MAIEMGEYLVGACLEHIFECDVVQYNVRDRMGGVDGLNELDVIGLKFADRTAYLCEVTTHIARTLYGSGAKSTMNRVMQKHEHQKKYAAKYLGNFQTHVFMFWSPRVPVGKQTEQLNRSRSLLLS